MNFYSCPFCYYHNGEPMRSGRKIYDYRYCFILNDIFDITSFVYDDNVTQETRRKWDSSLTRMRQWIVKYIQNLQYFE